MPVLQGSTLIYDYDLTDIVNYNIKQWLDYGLMEMGGYTTVKFNSPSSGFTILQSVRDNSYQDRQVYEAFGPSFAWETDVNAPSGYLPIFQVSGVYINNIFQPTSGIGVFQHNIDYKHGRVIFALPVPSGTTVKCEYTFKNIDVFTCDSFKWKTIVDQYEQRYNSEQTLSPSGMASILKANRVWLPCIAIESTLMNKKGLQLGGGDIDNCEIDFHIFADNPFIVNRICNALNNQFEKQFPLFNINTMPPVYNFNGSIASGALTYPVLAAQNSPYFWTHLQITSANGGPKGTFSDLYRGEVTLRAEVLRYLSTI